MEFEDAESFATQVERVSSHTFAFVPLPWRVIFLTGTGILCWATNLHFLHLVGIDPVHILDPHFHTNPHSARVSSPLAHTPVISVTDPTRLYPAVYKLFAAYATWSFGCWLFFRALCGGNINTLDQYKIVPELCAIGLLAALVCPLNVFRKRERDLFLHGLYRCLFSPINQPIRFSDVVLADIFTSFAKVLGDLWISTCMLSPWGSLRIMPVAEGWQLWIVPCLMSLPYFARLRQCLAEYFSSPQNSNKKALFNALKYATAFPVIYLSAAQRLEVIKLIAEKGSSTTMSPWYGETQLFRLWLLAVAVNSGYSFWWDVTNDWGLSLLQLSAGSRSKISSLPRPLPTRSPKPRSPMSTPALSISNGDDGHRPILLDRASQSPFPRGLRPTLLFHDPVVYYIAISLNLILRLTWSLKLSSHLHSVAELEGGIFLMEALELIRRWIWVFFRMEWETVKLDFGDGPENTAEVFRDIPGLELELQGHERYPL